MLKRLITLSLIVAAFTVCASAQANPALTAAQQKFIKAIETKNTAVFLSFISPKDGLRVMNTIDQGVAGNVDKPTLDATLTHARLKTDFAKKGDLYKSIFVASPDSPNFYDAFANRKEEWVLSGDSKFLLFDKADNMLLKQVYVTWKKIGAKWYVEEVGRMIS